MKKGIVLALLLLTLSSGLFSSANSIHEFTRSFTIQAGRSEFSTLVITPISSQTENYRIGMPFNIEDVQVQSTNQTTGRTIAEWSLISNTEFDLLIDAKPMRYIGSEGSSPDIPYMLTFECNLSLASGGEENISFYLDMGEDGESDSCGISYGDTTIDSANALGASSSHPGAQSFEFDILSGLSTGLADGGSFLGSLNGTIDFKFTKVTAEELASSVYPAGQYEAEVIVTLREVE